MTENQVFTEVQGIFRDVFDDESLNITNETNANDIEEWDSLEQINLIVAMESTFKIRFTIDEVSELKNVGEMIALINKKVNNE